VLRGEFAEFAKTIRGVQFSQHSDTRHAICTAAKKDAPALEELQTKVEEIVMQEGTEAKGAISEPKLQVIEKLETFQSSLVTAL
jgi:hypothetical protein